MVPRRCFLPPGLLLLPVGVHPHEFVGDKLYFQDMAIYSMVKNNTFNGIPLPGIAVMKEDGDCEMIRTFGYEDFKGRLA